MKTTISFTTIPNRIDKIKPMVDSLLRQTLISDEIVLWVGDDYKRVGGKIIIPDFIKNSRIRVEYCDDIGPFTKLHYSLDDNWEDKDCIIVTADDDVFYPPNWFENIVKASYANPDAAIGYRGRTLLDKTTKFIKYNNSKLFQGSTTDDPVKVDIITGTWGCLYKPRFFDEKIFGGEVTHENFFVDDIWINGNLAMNKIDRYVIPNVGVKPLDGVHNIDSLWSINAGGSNNNIMCDHFKKYW